MKNRKNVNFGKAAVSSLLVLSLLAACNTDEDNDEVDEGTSADTNTEETGAFEDEVTLRVPVYDRGVEGVPDVDDNYWTNWIQEEFGDENNINVEFAPITRQDVMTDYALLASSQDLPTMLMEYDYPKVSQWANDGYLTPFDMDRFSEIAPTYFAQLEDAQMPFTEMNDETYFILAERPNWDTPFNWQTFYRKDWLEQVGYDEYPQNEEEYNDAMIKIKEAGLADHPLGGNIIPAQGADVSLEYLETPVNEKEWATYISAVIPPMSYEPHRQFLKRENERYNLGLINPEYYLTDFQTAQSQFINGENFSHGEYISSNSDVLNSFYENNPDAELAVVPIVGDDPAAGTTTFALTDNPYGFITGFSSQATEDEVTAAMMYMEWMAQEENLEVLQWGIEGENYTINEETGLPESVPDYDGEFKQGFMNNKDYWAVVVEARRAGTREDAVRASVPNGVPDDFAPMILENIDVREELAQEDGRAMSYPAFTVPIEAESDHMGTLHQLYPELRDNLVMSEPDEFDALYDEYSQRYLDAGYQEIIDERAAAYDAGNTTKLINLSAE